MGARGPQAIAVDNSKVMEIPRAQPPEELTDEAASEWRAITNRMRSDHFGREYYPMLTQLCRHIVATRHQIIAPAMT